MALLISIYTKEVLVVLLIIVKEIQFFFWRLKVNMGPLLQRVLFGQKKLSILDFHKLCPDLNHAIYSNMIRNSIAALLVSLRRENISFLLRLSQKFGT